MVSEEYTPMHVQTLATDKQDIFIHTKGRHTLPHIPCKWNQTKEIKPEF